MTRKIVRINMSDLKATYEDVPKKWTKWGGRGMTSAIVFEEVPPTCHPLGPNACCTQQRPHLFWWKKPSNGDDQREQRRWSLRSENRQTWSGSHYPGGNSRKGSVVLPGDHQGWRGVQRRFWSHGQRDV